MKRRGFLQQAGWILAAMGMSEAGFSLLGDGAYQALAQPTRRKLALLVGIDQYPEVVYGGTGVSLAGCVTDVKLQRELLVHRFGFQAADILTLTNAQATRSQIQTAFVTHLREQAKAGDLVVFHFSGYGSQIQLPSDSDRRQNSLVPVDGVLPTKEPLAANDLPEETLWLMLRSLPTNNVLTVLDTSYTYPGSPIQGNLRIRSRPNPTIGQLGESEQAFQEKLRRDSKFLSRFANQRKVPGVVLSAAGASQIATEAQWQGFSAGLFTYALTQHLWWATPATSLQVSFQQAACTVEQLAGNEQNPQLCKGIAPPCQTPDGDPKEKISLLSPETPSGGDGVVLSVEEDGSSDRIWLAGLPAPVLESYGVGSILEVVSPDEAKAIPTRWQVRAREGLTVKAQRLGESGQGSPKIGQLVREAIRIVPRQPNLTVALDNSLERIERVDATSAFSAIRYVSPVMVGEQPADCLFGRVRRATLAQMPNSSLPPLADRGSYGLYSLGQELIPSSLGEGEEAVKTAVQRLVPQLQALRADKLLSLTANEGSSRLGVKASLVLKEPEERVLIEKQTLRGCDPAEISDSFPGRDRLSEGSVVAFPAGSRIQYRLQNLSDRPVYFLLFGLDTDGQAFAFYPFNLNSNPNEAQYRSVAPGETLTIPHTSDPKTWNISSPTGLAKIQLVCSHSPFTHTLEVLSAKMPRSLNRQMLPNPLEMAEAILLDLDQGSLPGGEEMALSKDVFALDVRSWATLSFIYRVVRSPIQMSDLTTRKLTKNDSKIES